MSKDIRINRGADFVMDVTIVNYVDVDYEALCYIKKSANDPQPIVNCTITKLVVGTGCKFRASLTAAETLLLKTRGISPMDHEQYVYDVIVKDTSGQIVRILEGYAWVSPGVSIEVEESNG